MSWIKIRTFRNQLRRLGVHAGDIDQRSRCSLQYLVGGVVLWQCQRCLVPRENLSISLINPAVTRDNLPAASSGETGLPARANRFSRPNTPELPPRSPDSGAMSILAVLRLLRLLYCSMPQLISALNARQSLSTAVESKPVAATAS